MSSSTLTILEATVDPAATATGVQLYSKDVTGTKQFFVRASDGTISQISGVGIGMSIGGTITSATLGSVLFAGAAGVLAQDNANFFWDDTNNRLGVGTATPGYSLDVRNAGASQIHIANGAVDSGGYLVSTVPSQLYISGGLGYDGTNLRAKATTASVIEMLLGNISFQGSSGLTIGAITAMTERMLLHVGGGLEILNSDAATVSLASRGKIRYTTTGQKPQWSSNGGAYFDLAQLTAPLTYSAVAASITFADVNGRLQQDNTNFNWDVTNVNLNVYSSNATGGSLFLRNTNASNTGPSAIGFLNRTGTFRTYIGFFPSAYAFTHLQGINGYFAFGGEDIALANATENAFRFGMTTATAFMAVANGSSAAVSAASTGRLRYNSSNQRFQISANAASYADVALTSGTLTAGSVFFANSLGQTHQDNANLFWDDTNNTLGLGTASPLTNYRVSVTTVTGGSGIQITGANTASYSGLDFYDSTAAFAGAVGYGNSTVAITHVQSKLFHYSASVDWVFANATRNEITLGMTTNSTFMQMQNGSSAAVSDVSTGRIRYNSGGAPAQRMQVSQNGAAYLDVVLSSGTLQAAALLFRDATDPTFVTNTTQLFWSVGQSALVVANTNTFTNRGSLQVTGQTALECIGAISKSTTSFAAVSFWDQAVVQKGGIGYGDTASTGFRQNRVYLASAGVDMVLAPNNVVGMSMFSATQNVNIGPTVTDPSIKLAIEAATASAGIQLGSGDTLPVSAASTGRLRYNTTGQKFQISKNAVAYEDMASLATAQTFTKSQNVLSVALTDAVNIATDASLGNVFTVTLAGNRTLDNPTNLVSGGVYRWVVTQDATGGRTLAYGTLFKWPGGTAPTLTVAANAIDSIEAVYNGTVLLATFALNLS